MYKSSFKNDEYSNRDDLNNGYGKSSTSYDQQNIGLKGGSHHSFYQAKSRSRGSYHLERHSYRSERERSRDNDREGTRMLQRQDMSNHF